MFPKNVVSATLAIAILVVCIDQGLAIRCWNCNSRFNGGCADPFNNSTIGYLSECLPTISLPNIQTVTQCRKIKHKENGVWSYIRGCNTNDQLNLYEATVYTCNHDGCNGANSNGPFAVLALLATPVALLLRLTNLL